MSKLRRAGLSALAGTALLGAWSAPACGQSTPSGNSPFDIGPNDVRRTRPIERTRAAQEAETYEAPGMFLGSFKLFPTIELNEVYDDNIYSTPYGVPGQTASFVQLVRPSIELRSDWKINELNFYANGALAFFEASSLNNYQDFAIGADGRLELLRDDRIGGGISFNRRHDAPGSPNVAVGQLQPSPYNLETVSLTYMHVMSNFTLRFDGQLDRYDWLYNVLGPAQGVILNTDRNRFEFREAVRLSYEFDQGYSVWARAGMNQRQYDSATDALGFMRSSAGWDVTAGFAFDFGGITSISAYVGFVQQSYQDSRFPQLAVPTFGLALYWNPVREITVKGIVRRTVEETITTTAASYLATTFGAEVFYEFRPNIRVDVFGSYTVDNYQSIAGIAPQYANYFAAGIGLVYYLTPQYYIGSRYQFSSRTSNVPGSDFGQNLFTFRLGARL